MAKKKRQVIKVAEFADKIEYPVVETTNGYQLEVRGVSILKLEDIQSKPGRIKPPTYEQDAATVAEGDTPETFDLDQSVIDEEDDPERKAEFQAKWDAYQEELGEVTADASNRIFDLLLSEGVEPIRNKKYKDGLAAWQEARIDSGELLPEKQADIEFEFLKLEVLARNEDSIFVCGLVRQQSGQQPESEDLAAALRIFRS